MPDDLLRGVERGNEAKVRSGLVQHDRRLRHANFYQAYNVAIWQLCSNLINIH